MRLRLLVLGVAFGSVFGWAEPCAFSEPDAKALEELPRGLWCEVGFEESFGDRAAPFYTIEIEHASRARGPTALFTRWTNLGLRPYHDKVVFRRRFAGDIQRHGTALTFVAPGWSLVVSPADATRAGELRISGRKLVARCGPDRGSVPMTPGATLLRSREFEELRMAAREALSDDYQLLYGPITSVPAGDRLNVEVALRKFRSHECGSTPLGPRLRFASVHATLRREQDDTMADGARWDVESTALQITDPAPPPVNTPSAEAIAAALHERYGAATTLEARFRIDASSRGIFAFERSEGVLRADLARGVSVRADGYRQLELADGIFRYRPMGRERHKAPSVIYRNALVFLHADLRDRFELARSRSQERCTEDYVLVATPRLVESTIERVSFYVDRKTLNLHHVTVRTPGSEYTLELHDERVGVSVPHAEFERVAPPGYELEPTAR